MNMGEQKDHSLDLNRLMGLNKVADLLDTSLRTVQRMVASGELPQPIRVGKLAKLQVQDVVDYIERQKQLSRGKE